MLYSHPVEIHAPYTIEHQIRMNQTVSNQTSQMVSLSPKLLLGDYAFFVFDKDSQTITLSEPFQALLAMLADYEVLSSDIYQVKTLAELNAVLQREQGQGGLLRKPGTERWEIDDQPFANLKNLDFEKLIYELGLSKSVSLNQKISVNHCLIFGARAERMESRIKNFLDLYQGRKLQSDFIYLLGSKRKLIPQEIEFISAKIVRMPNKQQKEYWQEVFSKAEEATEANAFLCLWECLVPQEAQKRLQDKLRPVSSTVIGSSYFDTQGHRPTTDITSTDWLAYYDETKTQTIFASAENPYGRLCDQMRSTILTKSRQASHEELASRIANTTFYFAHPQTKTSPLIGVVLDEIARNVYGINETLKYLEGKK